MPTPLCIYGHALRGPPAPTPNGLGSPPLLGWEGIPSFPPVVWGLVGGKPPPSPRGVGFGGVSWWARGGREASLVRQTLFCGRRFCSETLGCPLKCFGRPWRFVLGTLQYRAIKSVLMTSRPPIIDYTLCHILYIVYSRVYTIYIYILQTIFCVHGLFIYDSKTTQRRQSSSSHIASGHVGARL